MDALAMDALPLRHDADVAVARRRVREVGVEAGLDERAIGALATATTEIARNVVVHAHSGEIAIAIAEECGRRGVVVIARDAGPGIADVARAMEDGYSTAGGLGLGLAGAQRLVDDFAIESDASGTTVVLKKWRAT